MRLAFLNRDAELGRLSQFLSGEGGLAVLYGRRRLGKSRLIQEALRGHPAVYYVGDARDAPLQRRALAREVARLLPGFADVEYPEWEALLARLWREAPAGSVLAIDELPELVARSPELPSVVQKLLDERGPPLIVAGSSQHMMHGLVLDHAAPLYGRASEILRIAPLPAGLIADALDLGQAQDAVEHFAAWGGVPRYWELARGFPSRRDAFRALALDPLGVLHREPERLLLDDLSDPTRSASILSLVGRGCHRVSEIAGRLGMPATSLSHPIRRLLDLGLLLREIPYGRSTRDTKRTWYRVADPFLRAWYALVEPNRSRLEAGLLDVVSAETEERFGHLVGEAWEELARHSVPHMELDGHRFELPGRWWGRGVDGLPLEIDLIARAVDDPGVALVGEAKCTCTVTEARSLLPALERKAARCPALAGCRVVASIWVAHLRGRSPGERIVDAERVMSVLR